MTVILDPGHGMANRKPGIYDPGACSAGVTEADIAMDWCNELRGILMADGHYVVRTRVDRNDPAPVSKRAGIAKHYGGDVMLSIHCNAATGAAHGTETFYRGVERREKAAAINQAVVDALGTRNRGAKTESASQHARLAVMEFQPCFLLELGFIDNTADRERMLDPEKRQAACEALAKVLANS